MNLKEAFRYQNCLASKIREAGSYLSNQDNLYETTQLHKHHEVKQELENKTVTVEVERPYKADNVVADWWYRTPEPGVNYLHMAR